jgi:hypothetical protein
VTKEQFYSSRIFAGGALESPNLKVLHMGKTRDRIYNTSFSTSLTNAHNKLEHCITLS